MTLTSAAILKDNDIFLAAIPPSISPTLSAHKKLNRYM
jgi:hypothetical protein